MSDEAEFRRWLVERVKHTRWVRRADDTVEAVALRLGVQPSVIEEAQAQLDQDRRQRGDASVKVGAGRPTVPKRKFDLPMPLEVFEDWKALCGLKRMTSSALLRSLIWTLLSSPAQPEWVGAGWLYRDRLLATRDTPRVRGRWPYVAKTEITHGASRALAMRASATNTTPTALVRGQVLDLLEGRLKRVHVINSITAMWDDEKRYWTLQKVSR